MKKTVEIIPKTGLCVSCGICKAVCMHDAISYKRVRGLYIPQIDEEKCKECGICHAVCPGKCELSEVNLPDAGVNPANNMEETLVTFTAMTKDNNLLRKATSGGVVSTLVKRLLEEKLYDIAFLVDSYDYSDQVHTVGITDVEEMKNTPKSRYIPVSQTNAVEYMIKNKDKKVILVGVGCFVQGIDNVISRFKLSRENYLVIGLFCDKNYNYNIYRYFENKYADAGKLKELYFRTKENGGWPGDMRLVFDNGKYKDLDKQERIKLKDFFQLERCLYCMDKLNPLADISVGDNYTKENDISGGTSSVIIRTPRGMNSWEVCRDDFKVWDTTIEKIQKSQLMQEKEKNKIFHRLKCGEKQVNKQYEAYKKEYRDRLRQLQYGMDENWRAIEKTLKKRKSKLRSILLRFKYYLFDLKTRLLSKWS